MLMPRKVRHRKQQRGRLRGNATGGTRLAFGEYGIQAIDPGWLGRHLLRIPSATRQKC